MIDRKIEAVDNEKKTQQNILEERSENDRLGFSHRRDLEKNKTTLRKEKKKIYKTVSVDTSTIFSGKRLEMKSEMSGIGAK